jgi:catechol 2,3-dioxygenase-like lactoylglutathione lyase family enzyme
MTDATPSVPRTGLVGLLHVAIKTADLAATRRFYIDILGMEDLPRPDFGYPGAWIGMPGAGAVIHVYAGGPALGPEGRAPVGSAAIDHVSITAAGYHGFTERFRAAGIPFREFIVPGTALWQLFVYDPSGVQIELTFDSTHEVGPPPDLREGRRYVAGESFFHGSADQ